MSSSEIIEHVFVLTLSTDINKYYQPYFNYKKPVMIIDEEIRDLFTRSRLINKTHGAIESAKLNLPIAKDISDRVVQYVNKQNIQIENNNVGIILDCPALAYCYLHRALADNGLVPIESFEIDYGGLGKWTRYHTYREMMK